ncbi:PP2C family serine/threonine-protein phosphatase [Thiocystis violascens]|uniref:PPM-type phosphatase domain-containing protein n=1 Tax=Thiocystis violascens (strain ATCC 17096 / DSM 198 / 6111) TaxID=765911 RepID=I3YCV6_THIV6|nr:PP2C family serine/threonine-protein phosphatase [Thiocystis violascens]AFL74824.1 hypothetical protein Thivi_2919 [Thiocystis violascens DSM 198]
MLDAAGADGTMPSAARKPTPEQRQKLAPEIENLIWGLFGPNDRPFFDRSEIAPVALDEFVQCDEVFEETFRFLDALTGIWNQRRPGRPLKPFTQDRQPKEIAMPMVLPVLSETPVSRREESKAGDESAPTEANIEETSAMPFPHPPDTPTPGSAQGSPGQVPAASTAPAKPPEPRASFQLPNGKVGVDYAARIEGRDAEGRPVRIRDVRIPDGLGLSFDPDSGELRGTPALDGDHRLPLSWYLDEKTRYSGECLLIVNPDPKSLWKVIEPPDGSPYLKPHADRRLLTGRGFSIAAASRRGRSHEHAGTFRDDDFFIGHDAQTQWSLILVADGAGSARYSREGARLAVTSAGAHLSEALAGEIGARMTAALDGWEADPEGVAQAMGAEFHYLFHKAGTLAVQSIEQEARSAGTEVRDYATTLLAAAVKRRDSETFLATFWIGDGAIAAYGPRGRVRLMGTPDGGEFAGQTRFLDHVALADQAFAKRIGIGRYADLSAVMLMTDGVSDPRFETDNGLNDPAKWDGLWGDIAPLMASPEPDRNLVDWLHFFTPGHHDDRTLALLW